MFYFITWAIYNCDLVPLGNYLTFIIFVFVRKIFCVFKSLCKMCCWCRYCSAMHIWINHLTTCTSGKCSLRSRCSRSLLYKSPPSAKLKQKFKPIPHTTINASISILNHFIQYHTICSTLSPGSSKHLCTELKKKFSFILHFTCKNCCIFLFVALFCVVYRDTCNSIFTSLKNA